MGILIRGNEKLFNDFRFYASRLSSMGAIVQNDGEISEDDIREFHTTMTNIINQLCALESNVGVYINSFHKDNYMIINSFDTVVMDTTSPKEAADFFWGKDVKGYRVFKNGRKLGLMELMYKEVSAIQEFLEDA